MGKNILIAGGTGLIGTALSSLLSEKGYQVALLSRSGKSDQYKTFRWDIEKGYLEEGTLQFADGIVFLSGENVGAKRWSEKQKDRILNSRVQAVRLLTEKIEKAQKKPEFFISASAIGYYGGTLSNHLSVETDPPGKDFLAVVTRQWEQALQSVKERGIRLVVLRTGVVLSSTGGALPKMITPLKMGLGSALGTGKQFMSWIELNDLARMYLHAIENEKLNSVYNAVAPSPVENQTFMKLLAKALGKPFFLPPVPTFLLRLALGEMADLLLKGNNVSSQKIKDTGFKFRFEKPEDYFKTLVKQT